MITLSLGALVNAEPALSRLGTQRLPAKTAYQVAKLIRKVADDTKHFQGQRNALIKELGADRPATDAEKATGSGETVTEVTVENRPAFFARLQELADVSVDLDATPVDLATLGEISPADLIALGPLVTGGDY